MKKRIGILTSGGDSAGLNAVLRSVTLCAVQEFGWDVYGIKHGTLGLLQDPIDYKKFNLNSFDGSILRMGGTILGTTNKDDPFNFPIENGKIIDRSQEIIEGYKKLNIDALIVVGGDGSFRIMHKLAEKYNMNLIGIPKTIDNDLGLTDNSVGFMTAVEIATEALDRLQPTAYSHERVMVLEVMGRDAGHIALHSGIAGGADVILIPEIPYKIKNLVSKIKYILSKRQGFALVVVAESVKTELGKLSTIKDKFGRERYGGIGHYLSDKINEFTGAEARFVALGHVQRGAQPIANDRVIAAAFGVKAVHLIAEGNYGRMVAWQNRKVVDVSLMDAIDYCRVVDINGTLVKTARSLGISFGDE